MGEFRSSGGQPKMSMSPGGFEFGVQGWHYADPIPKSITFFLDNTVLVADQYGRPIRGVVAEGKELWFAITPPEQHMDVSLLYQPRSITIENKSVPLATHAQVIAALTAERIDWKKIPAAGWPQLTYTELKKLGELPPTPLAELRMIRDPQLRKDAMRMRREYDDIRTKELVGAEDE